MTSLNQVILTGKVVNPPRPHYRPDGSPVIQFPLELDDSEDRAKQAVNRVGSRQALLRTGSGQAMNRSGTGQGLRKRINIVAFGKLAEFKFDLLQGGQRLMVVGKLNQRCWQTPEGKNRIRTEVIATELRTIEEKHQRSKSKLKKEGE